MRACEIIHYARLTIPRPVPEYPFYPGPAGRAFARLPQCVPMPPARAVSPFAFAVLGMEMVGFTVVGVLIDWLTGLTPWFTVALTLLGVVVAFLHLAQIGAEGVGPEVRR